MKKETKRQKETAVSEAQKKFRTRLVIAAFVLFALVLFALVYLSTTPEAATTLLLSFAGGVSNIILPCTLPLVFIIVPIAMLAGRKGIAMTLLFGLGLTITLAVYGAVVALIGQYLGLDAATRVMYSLAGIASLIFGLSELKLITLKLPGYARMPGFIQKRGDYIKVFALGLLLGNAGVGCPNPITYVILVFAATTGDWLQGAMLMGMNGIGRVVPLLLLTVLGILGVNTVGWLAKKSDAITKFTAWTLVVLGSFILLNGIFGHLWYEGGVFHEGLNAAFMAAGGKMIGEADVEIEGIEKPVRFMEYGALFNLIVTLLPVFWYWRKYPKARREVLMVLLIFIVWDFLLFDFGLNAMNWLGIGDGLP